MKTRRRRKSASVLNTMTELGLASWETILRRTLMMSSGTCSPAEYRRMVREKAAAMMETVAVSRSGSRPPSMAALLAPWHRKATANARRLRRK